MLLFQVAGAQSSLPASGKTDSGNPLHRSCGMDAHMETLLQDPAYRKAHEQKLAFMENMPQERSPCGTPATLPVAVHYQNISNPNIPCLIQLAQEQIDILNADINGTNSDISNWTNSASSFFPGVANGETCVSFCLATRNHPAGFGLSDGYPAITINQTTGDFNPAWAGYINIYVRGNGGGLLGYSPLGGDGDGDGVVVFLEGWGTGSGCYPGLPVSAYNLGRTLTHEMGHYLLLDHIFSGGCNNLDAVADTPAEAGPYFGCPALGAATCGSTDMHMNFMDYTNDACMYMFSAGQSSRMENYLNANLQNVIANAANVCGPVTCPPGYYPITEVIYGETVVVGCQPCPPGSYCPNGVDAYPCPANTYNPLAGQAECLDCPSGTSSNPGATICTEPVAGGNISGNIKWEHNMDLGVNLTTVKLTGDQTATTTTNNGGFYSVTYTSGSNFTVTPSKNINKLNGVTVADATAIQQHVANIALLPAPFKRIAADVNKSNTITTLDATLINQALLGNPNALAQIKTSWRFVPSAYSFPNPNIPWGFPEIITLTGVSGDVPGQDFKGIKTADVVTTYANPANFGEGEPLVLRAWDQALHAGESIAVEVAAGQSEDLTAFQFALAFDPAQLQFEFIEPLSGLPLTEAHFGTYNAAQGEIRVAWSHEEGLRVVEAAPVFRLVFTALKSGSKLSELLHLGHDILPAKAYNEALSESDVRLIIEGITSTTGLAASKFALTSRPNPFSGSTTIEFVLPESCEATLRVLNTDGRELWRVNKTYPAGNNAEVLQLEAGVAHGVLYCELLTSFGTQVRRMVAVQ